MRELDYSEIAKEEKKQADEKKLTFAPEDYHDLKTFIQNQAKHITQLNRTTPEEIASAKTKQQKKHFKYILNAIDENPWMNEVARGYEREPLLRLVTQNALIISDTQFLDFIEEALIYGCRIGDIPGYIKSNYGISKIILKRKLSEMIKYKRTYLIQIQRRIEKIIDEIQKRKNEQNKVVEYSETKIMKASSQEPLKEMVQTEVKIMDFTEFVTERQTVGEPDIDDYQYQLSA